MNKSAIILLCVIAATATAYAQDDKDLNKTIVVEKEFVPVEIKAVKPVAQPKEAPLTTEKVQLRFSDWALPAQFEPQAVVQSPIAYPDESLAKFRRRGYLDLAMGNYLNIVGSAGYRIIDKEKTSLGVWLQHNSTSADLLDDDANDKGGKFSDPEKQNIIDDRLGVDFNSKLRRGIIDASLGYHFSKFNYFAAIDNTDTDDDKEKQTVNDFRMALGWRSLDDAVTRYRLGAEFNYFGFDYGKLKSDNIDGLSEIDFRLKAAISQVFGDSSYAGVDAAFQLVGLDNIADDASALSSETFGMVSLTPNYEKRTDDMRLRIGARVDLSFNNGATFRIAPDVKFDYAFSDVVSLAVDATGGNTINTVHNLFARNRYMTPSVQLPTTYTLIDATAAIRLGLVKGFSISPFVGFAATRHSIVPTMLFNPTAGQISYADIDLNGLKVGLELGYRYGSLVDFSAKYAFTPQDEDSGYVVDDNRAEHNFDAIVNVRPISKLNIGIGYRLRALRTVSSVNATEEGGAVYSSKLLSNISNINLSASYQINDLVSVFCHANNLLNREYEFYDGIPAQKFNILGGVGLTF
ncbi:MAG: hypothetical protein ACI31D_07720 [Candidatus Limisoma sp.]